MQLGHGEAAESVAEIFRATNCEKVLPHTISPQVVDLGYVEHDFVMVFTVVQNPEN